MNKREKIAELRRFLARHGPGEAHAPVSLGHAGADACLGGGLRSGALHEVFARDWGAGGFALLLAIRAAAGRPLFWVRPDYEALEYGGLAPQGVADLGGDPRTLTLVRAPHARTALAAAGDILACPHVGALLLEIGGMPKSLDLTASRRLALAAEERGVTAILLREGAEVRPGAALTRWEVESAPSAADDDDWGDPVFDAALTRHRLGGLGRFSMQWNSEVGRFIDPFRFQRTSLRPSSPVASRASREGEDTSPSGFNFRSVASLPSPVETTSRASREGEAA